MARSPKSGASPCGVKPPNTRTRPHTAEKAGLGGHLLGWRCALVLLAFLPFSVAAAVENPLDCPENVSLCIQAARSGGIDLKTGTAELDGNVRGYIKERELRFAAESLKAFRNEGKEWTRLVLDRNVRLNQPDTVATADHAVLEQERALLFGNGRAERPPYKIEADEIELQDAPSSITAKGTTEKPARVFYNPGEGADAKTSGDEPTATGGR